MSASHPVIDPILAAMEQESPPPSPRVGQAFTQTSLGKRTRSPDEESEDELKEVAQEDLAVDSSVASVDRTSHSGIVSQNMIAHAVRYAQRKRLRGDQITAVELFMKELPTGQIAQVFANQLALENKLDKILTSAPAFQLSADLKKNIHNYSICVLLSSKISAYKGNIPRNHVINVIKKFRFDLPPNIEQNTADWGRVVSHVSYELTQIRAMWKKTLKASIAQTENTEHVDIYNLSMQMIGKSDCKITVPLACRVALMRAYVATTTDSTFWNEIDKRLKWIQEASNGDAKKIQRAFAAYLDADRKTHGRDSGMRLDEDTDERQNSVDEVIASSIESG